MREIKDRIKRIRSESRLSMEKFGDRIGITRSSVCKLENGENNPSEQTIRLICKEFKIRYQWLTEGIEPMKETLDTDSMTRIDEIMTGENEFAKNLFKKFSRLKNEEWELLEKIIYDLANDKGD